MSKHELLEEMQKAVGRVLFEKEKVTELILTALVAGGHVLLEDVPGTGKTVLSKTMADFIDATFRRIQFTPDVLPGDVTGIRFFNMKTEEFEYREGPVMTNILLADEINRATPRTQSSLLEAMEEGQATVDGETHRLPGLFFVIATQNPIESAQGTFDLPEAQMDRFLMKIRPGYPSEAGERAMIQSYMHGRPAQTVSSATVDDILAIRREALKIRVNEAVEEYLIQLVRATRDHPEIETGASPRGTIALMRAVQARAHLHGRSFAVPEDVRELAVPVLAHRLVLTVEASMRKTSEEVLEGLLGRIPVPVEDVPGR
ncbi:AAA family ATPase [Bhargavaea cecembensis]|uniref:AAA family ATPase n=1 Tax=Bhargavaea cecembensis TaxID=394098 RepID=UPI000590569A|nr:MoxR family ATPase [Bhargavaea cecembensis]